MGRVRGEFLSHCWSPAVQRSIRQKRRTTRTTAPCLLPPPAPGRLVSVSQQTMKSCEAWLKIHLQPKSCGSSQAGWSQWWRRRSRGGGGGEEAAPEVEVLQRRQPWRRTLPDSWTNQTKTLHHRAPMEKLKGLLPNPLRTKTPPHLQLCSRSLSEVILLTLLHICPLTCRCSETFLCVAGWRLNPGWRLSWESSCWAEEEEAASPRAKTQLQPLQSPA